MGGLIYANFKGKKEGKKNIARARVLSVTLVTRTVFSPNVTLNPFLSTAESGDFPRKKRKLFDANQSFQLREAVVFSHLTM